jgi:hypothetical protein
VRCSISFKKGYKAIKDFPRVQKPGSFTIDDAMVQMSDAASGAGH